MITIIAYIINLLAPIVNTLGAIGLCGCVVYEDLHIIAIAGVLAIIGLIFGLIFGGVLKCMFICALLLGLAAAILLTVEQVKDREFLDEVRKWRRR